MFCLSASVQHIIQHYLHQSTAWWLINGFILPTKTWTEIWRQQYLKKFARKVHESTLWLCFEAWSVGKPTQAVFAYLNWVECRSLRHDTSLSKLQNSSSLFVIMRTTIYITMTFTMLIHSVKVRVDTTRWKPFKCVQKWGREFTGGGRLICQNLIRYLHRQILTFMKKSYKSWEKILVLGVGDRMCGESIIML